MWIVDEPVIRSARDSVLLRSIIYKIKKIFPIIMAKILTLCKPLSGYQYAESTSLKQELEKNAKRLSASQLKV